jgi:rubrerythrin
MNNENLSLLDALQIAKAAERKAAQLYADAAQQTANPLGRELFEKLAEFEHNHYLILSDAYWSLDDRGVWTVPG